MKKIILYIAIIIAIIGLSILIYFNVNDNYINFLSFNINNLITLIIAIIVSYYFTQKKNDIRKLKEKAENVIEKIQNIILQEKYYIISSKNYENELTVMMRNVKNKLSILDSVSKELGIESEIEYCSSEFRKYCEFIGNHIKDKTYLSNSQVDLQRFLSLIDDKLDSVKIKLYK